MSSPILPVSTIIPVTAPASANPAGNVGHPFGDVLSDAIQKVEAFHDNAGTSVARFLNGDGEELHQVALKVQQADLSFQLFLQIRNRIVSAYQEVMRMQV